MKRLVEESTIFLTPDDQIANDHVTHTFQIVNMLTLSSFIGLFGVGANIINLIIFFRHGLNDSVNISLLSLAVSDLGALLTMLWHNVCVNPLLTSSYALPIVPLEFRVLASGLPHVFFSRVTCWITIFISVERCLCITKPLQVKLILTPKRTVLINALIFIFIFAMTFPTAYLGTHRIGWKFYPSLNRTLLGLILTDNRQEVEEMSNVLASMSQVGSFITILVTTLVLTLAIKRVSEWRDKNASSRVWHSEQLSRRNQRLATMISLLSIILIVCYIPSTTCFLASACVAELNPTGKYKNIYSIAWSFVWVFEAVNSSVGTFLYYTMSSKYRSTFNLLFSRTSDTSLSLRGTRGDLHLKEKQSA